MTNIHIMVLGRGAFYSPSLRAMGGRFLKGEGLDPRYTLATPDNRVADALRGGKAHLSEALAMLRYLLHASAWMGSHDVEPESMDRGQPGNCLPPVQACIGQEN